MTSHPSPEHESWNERGWTDFAGRLSNQIGVCIFSCVFPHLVLELHLPAAFPLLKDFSQLVQTSMVEVQDLVLTLSASYDQLTTCAGLITASERCQKYTAYNLTLQRL